MPDRWIPPPGDFPSYLRLAVLTLSILTVSVHGTVPNHGPFGDLRMSVLPWQSQEGDLAFEQTIPRPQETPFLNTAFSDDSVDDDITIESRPGGGTFQTAEQHHRPQSLEYNGGRPPYLVLRENEAQRPTYGYGPQPLRGPSTTGPPAEAPQGPPRPGGPQGQGQFYNPGRPESNERVIPNQREVIRQIPSPSLGQGPQYAQPRPDQSSLNQEQPRYIINQGGDDITIYQPHSPERPQINFQEQGQGPPTAVFIQQGRPQDGPPPSSSFLLQNRPQHEQYQPEAQERPFSPPRPQLIERPPPPRPQINERPPPPRQQIIERPLPPPTLQVIERPAQPSRPQPVERPPQQAFHGPPPGPQQQYFPQAQHESYGPPPPAPPPGGRPQGPSSPPSEEIIYEIEPEPQRPQRPPPPPPQPSRFVPEPRPQPQPSRYVPEPRPQPRPYGPEPRPYVPEQRPQPRPQPPPQVQPPPRPQPRPEPRPQPAPRRPQASAPSRQQKPSSYEDDEVESFFGGGGSGAIPGSAGTDYPTLTTAPQTDFSCAGKTPGFYADIEHRCQVYYLCSTGGHKQSFLCPNGTVFNQASFVCEWWYNVDCKNSEKHFSRNEDLYKTPEPKKEETAEPEGQQRRQEQPPRGHEQRGQEQRGQEQYGASNFRRPAPRPATNYQSQEDQGARLRPQLYQPPRPQQPAPNYQQQQPSRNNYGSSEEHDGDDYSQEDNQQGPEQNVYVPANAVHRGRQQSTG